MSKTLVIVESPAKARTIAAFLGDEYVVESSIGHIRDLPKRAGDIPEAFKKMPWSRLGVDVENGFKPLYVVDADKKSHITKLKKLLKEADQLLLATDEDREGESIAWHLFEVLKPKVPVRRMVFHEITKSAIAKAIDNPREIDRRLVDAQEARRILDRLYGYEVSPVLWRKVMPRLSAGRVQSVATRMIVQRERDRRAFVPAHYWDIAGDFATRGTPAGTVTAQLVAVDGAPLADGKDFDDKGELKKKVAVLDEAAARKLSEALPNADFSVRKLEKRPYRRSPSAPFMTSTLQQEAGRKLRFAAKRTMTAAQRLYENGFITYMRTDSTTLSDSALTAARAQIERLYGADYLPAKPRVYKKKVKNAQEAHEAIRPAGDSFRTPESVKGQLGSDEAKLYELIWKRTLASQMEDARGESLKLRIAAKTEDGREVEFAATGNTILFPGYLRAYVEGSDDPEAELDSRERHLPAVTEGESLDGVSFDPRGHQTQPPARFTEASLVRQLEELGVGRPSTYASIISTILDRGYVWKKGSALVPSFKAFAVISLLEQHFTALVDYAFTARMEDELDAIARGDEATEPWLRRFYFGVDDAERKNGNRGVALMSSGLHALVSEDHLEGIDARAVNTLAIGTDPEGRDIAVRVGRYGPYLQRGEQNANVPEDLPPAELSLAMAIELLDKPSGDRELGTDPETELPVLLREGRYGNYVQLGEAGEGKDKPRTCSLLRTMTAEDVTLADALKLLSLPRDVGPDAEGTMITSTTGRYGPYIARGADRRSLESDDQIFSVTVEEALHLLAQPRTRSRRAAPPPLKELGADPVSGETITLREGRFGPYVTDGETNASLRREDSVDQLTPERAQELLQLRRERGPSKKRKKKATKKKTAKKATAQKKTAKKKTAKKAAVKKTAAKKTAAKKTAAKKTAAKKTAAKKTAAKKKTAADEEAAAGQKKKELEAPSPLP